MITKEFWRRYVNKLSAIDKRAGDLMQSWINEHGLEDEQALINYAYGLTTKYGEASATLSCEMYDYMADMSGAGVPDAVPAETATYREVARGAMWGKYHSPSQIPSVVSRQVRQAGADTMIQNAKRDHAEWAWIPQSDTCAFCITLASRGWQDASKTVLRGNHAEHIHQNCDCTFAIAFKTTDKKQYDAIYDPGKYLEMYENAEGTTPKERINYIRRELNKNNNKSDIKIIDESNVVSILRKEYHPWVESLNDEEIHAIRKYTKNSHDEEIDSKFFSKLNAMLRGQIPNDDTLQYYAEVISRALKKSPLKEGIVCYRSLSKDPFPGVNVDEVINGHQFFSTSVIKSKAFKGDYKITILAPPGTNGAYLDEISRIPRQREFLLDKDNKYRLLLRKGKEMLVLVVV